MSAGAMKLWVGKYTWHSTRRRAWMARQPRLWRQTKPPPCTAPAPALSVVFVGQGTTHLSCLVPASCLWRRSAACGMVTRPCSCQSKEMASMSARLRKGIVRKRGRRQCCVRGVRRKATCAWAGGLAPEEVGMAVSRCVSLAGLLVGRRRRGVRCHGPGLSAAGRRQKQPATPACENSL